MTENPAVLLKETEVPLAVKEYDQEPQGLEDLHNEAGLASLSEALKKSEGKCLVVVHPFYAFKRENTNIINEPGNKKLKDFMTDLSTLIKNFQRQNIPVVIMQDAKTGDMHRTEDSVSTAEQKIRKHLKELLSIEDDKGIFFIITEQGSPDPLISWSEENQYLASIPNIKLADITEKFSLSFVNKLKTAGLKLALFAGTNFGGGQDFSNQYRAARFNPIYGLFSKEKNWKLADYYSQKRPEGYATPPHPFQVISPEGCLASAIRMFAHENIEKIGITNATFPEKMPTIKQINEVSTIIYEVK